MARIHRTDAELYDLALFLKKTRIKKANILHLPTYFFSSSLEERQRAEKKNREEKGHEFTPRWFDKTDEICPTTWDDLQVYQYNGKYTEHRAAIDDSDSVEAIDVKSIEFNPWQYENLAA